ncbi:hypothetical protein J7T55_006437 [Diaporthe amygdali]|uniref:uncharacterized protein n=1 Tax=Phomopsis amygdali TaxID=1214568 RepID=UPI0022FE8095|nr:uncharacterized protein J7T55_006437 [Diaporthe amygdali]KAJ0125093.1 hypothetical protein J7T55_006437 [Diaporthe amygdali]
MAPTPQSRFLEGSMNDRASNAPPPDFLGFDADNTAEYERQFALDWKPPDLGLNHHGTRTSLMSISSAVSSATTSHKQNGSSFLKPLWGGVKERLSLNRSKSSNNVHDRDDDSSCHGHIISPTFKHQRSESINVTRHSRTADPDSFASSGDGAKLKKFPSAAAIPNAGMPGSAAFDPTNRPTRDEIAANYQSLLASGFFGNRAIQSTRFSAPGGMQNRSSMPSGDSFAQRMAENEQQEQHQDAPMVPPPERQPPPPPPSRTAPPPPPPPVESIDTTSSSSSAGSPFSPAFMLQPGSLEQQQASRDMPPPPSPPKQRKPGHKPSLSFSSVPYTSTRPANEPSVSRPFRPPPVSLARFSLDSGRRSFDFKLGNDSNRGIKRPFVSTNDSEMSLDRPSYDMINGDGSGSMVTALEDGGHESGARKLVKKLRKSASRISMDLGKSISRPASSNFEADNGDVHIADPPSAPRHSMSSSIRRSFSWRLGRSAQETKDDNKRRDISSNDDRTDNAAEETAVPSFKSERFIPPSLSVIMDAPESPERNKLKKRDIRGRRLRRQEANNKPTSSPALHHSQFPFLSPPSDGDSVMTDWQSTRGSDRTKSRSRSRPRRSELSMMMQSQPTSQSQSQSRPGTAHSTDSSYSFATSTAASYLEPRRSAEVVTAAPSADDSVMGGVEPVEFVVPSFHFPNRVRPGGNPLTVIPDANRGIPSVPNIPGEFRDVKIVARERCENEGDNDDDNGGDGAAQAGGSAWPSAQAVF